MSKEIVHFFPNLRKNSSRRRWSLEMLDGQSQSRRPRGAGKSQGSLGNAASAHGITRGKRTRAGNFIIFKERLEAQVFIWNHLLLLLHGKPTNSIQRTNWLCRPHSTIRNSKPCRRDPQPDWLTLQKRSVNIRTSKTRDTTRGLSLNPYLTCWRAGGSP